MRVARSESSEAVWQKNQLFTAEPEWPGGLLRPNGGGGGGPEVAVFSPLLDTRATHARPRPRMSAERGHVHSRLEESCVYSGNKK